MGRRTLRLKWETGEHVDRFICIQQGENLTIMCELCAETWKDVTLVHQKFIPYIFRPYIYIYIHIFILLTLETLKILFGLKKLINFIISIFLEILIIS